MRNFLFQHHKNTIQTIPFQVAALEKGMIVKLRYRAESHKKILKEYILVILNPNWKHKIHALSLEHVPEKTFMDLAENTGIVYAKNVINYKKLNIPKLLIELSSNRFYHRKLKLNISNKYNDSYRTFNIERITDMRLIDYDFGLDVKPIYQL